MKTSTRSVLSLWALVLLGWASTTLAAPPSAKPTHADQVPTTKTVRFGNLDVSTAVGAERLYGRIRVAASMVCRELPHSAVRNCRARAVDDAVTSIDNALLSSIHRSTVERVEQLVRK
jgi:UrcA family protein